MLCIDECQKGPWIFPVIKDIVGTKRRPSQFLLTGSIRFTLKNEIQESLTGRIILFELLPFTLAEATHRSPSSFLGTCLKSRSDNLIQSLNSLKKAREIGLKQITRHATLGGMPIPCFARDDNRRKLWFDGFFETLIGRDLALVDVGLVDIAPSQGQAFLKRLSLMQSEELNFASLAKASALSLDKAKRFLRALVSLCLIDLIIPENHAEKSQKKMRVEWKDSGLWNYFNQTTENALQDNQTAMSLFLSQELRYQLGTTNSLTQWTYYKSHNGASIPWIFRQGPKTIAMMYAPTENPTPYHYRALKQFVKREKKSVGIILGPIKSPLTMLDHNIVLMPFTLAL